MKSSIRDFIRLFLPRDNLFFDGLREIADQLLKQAEILKQLPDKPLHEWDHLVQLLQQLEKNGDEAVEALQLELQKSFIAPLDHGEIELLATALQRISHRMGEAGLLIRIHAIRELPECTASILERLLLAVREVFKNVERLSSRKDLSAIRASNREIRRLEVEVDLITEQNIQNMHEGIELDVKSLIYVWKNEGFIRTLEKVLDACNEFALACGAAVVRNM